MTPRLPTLTSAVLAATALLAAASGTAGPMSIAQVPLMNIGGTGTVKPNLMLLYDNSGSMASQFTPDYVDDSTSCRNGAVMSSNGGPVSCSPGHAPFHAAAFNKQYYNPEVRYTPPVNADGSSYPAMTAAATANWTNVPTDGFGVDEVNLLGNSAQSTNLVSGFPDKKFCTSSGGSTCATNTATYSYPDNTYRYPTNINTNAYYYNVHVAEWCTDTNMTNCTSVPVGAASPSGYPVAARVRFCDSTALTNCQAKYVGNFKYPRYANVNGGLLASYGTITIGASTSAGSVNINSITVNEGGNNVVITNGAVNASTGTNTSTKQATAATNLALSIIQKTGLTHQYTACVKTPTGTNAALVPACSNAALAINLGGNNVVAVVPINCRVGATSKSFSDCWIVTDDSRAGWSLSANAPASVVTPAKPATALLTVSGTSNKNNNPVLASMKLGAKNAIAGNLSLPKNSGSSTLATSILNAINSYGNLDAYPAGNAISPTCQAASGSSVICVVDPAATSGGAAILMGSLSNNTGGSTGGTVSFNAGTSVAPVAAVSDAIPVTTTAMSAGAAVFERVDIVASRNSYPRGGKRDDCAGATCTYAEEMTNFANWYAYYKSRNQMMKTAVGQAFQPINANFKVGIVSLSSAAAGGAMTVPKDFSGSDRTTWYNTLYGMSLSGATPLRLALNNVGRMYANLSPYNYAAGSEVVQFPCQQNFTFMTTDGYWNGGAPSGIPNGDTIDSPSTFCTRGRGCVDPAAQGAPSLADVALYWYRGGPSTNPSNVTQFSLRPALEDWTRPGLVPSGSGDNTRLHMNTYTLGLGVDGVLTFEPNYDTSPVVGGDFYKLITGVTSGCPWNGGGAYNWPDVQPTVTSTSAALQSRVDDLWHAAINGRGKHFSASDPAQVISGLRQALANIEVKVGAAAAAATSTPNISQQDNDIFSTTFTTVKWYGELSDRRIDTVTGEVGSAVQWTSSDMVGRKVGASTDTRVIKMLDASSGTLKDFSYSAMTGAERAWFDNKCSLMAQCPLLSSADRAIVNDGENLINWLRGQQEFANDTVFRAYSKTATIPTGLSAPIPIVLGDIASSKPAYLREPRKAYDLPGYNAFAVANASRAATVFAAANDGMLHAFDAKTGEELWGYAPRITMKKLHLQASITYGTNHQFSVDGSPELGDVKIGNDWRTVLVAGLNAGGRGYYALDVTDPNNPKALWEICADATVCSGQHLVPDLGLTFGNPQFGVWNNTWVVYLTSGYNNVPGTDGVPTGDGGGYLYIVDVATGAVLKKVGTSSPSTATPPGLARITAISKDPNVDPVTTYIYGGDNQGQMWRFDLTDPNGAVTAIRMGNAGPLQPITTRPEVTTCRVRTTTGDIAQRMVLFGTGRLLDVPDISNGDLQSLYALRDDGSEVLPLRGPDLVQQSLSTMAATNGVSNYSATNRRVDLALKKGWYMDLNQNSGERVNLDPRVVSGTLIAVTNLPSASSACSVGGTSNVYHLNACSGGYVTSNSSGIQSGGDDAGQPGADGVGIPVGRTLSNTSAAVGFIIVRLPSGALKIITTMADGSTDTSEAPPSISPGSRKAGWRSIDR